MKLLILLTLMLLHLHLCGCLQFQTKGGHLSSSCPELTLCLVPLSLPYFFLFLVHCLLFVTTQGSLGTAFEHAQALYYFKNTQGDQNAFAWPCCLFWSIYCLPFAERQPNFLFPRSPLALPSRFLSVTAGTALPGVTSGALVGQSKERWVSGSFFFFSQEY